LAEAIRLYGTDDLGHILSGMFNGRSHGTRERLRDALDPVE